MISRHRARSYRACPGGCQYPGFLVVQPVADGALNRGALIRGRSGFGAEIHHVDAAHILGPRRRAPGRQRQRARAGRHSRRQNSPPVQCHLPLLG